MLEVTFKTSRSRTITKHYPADNFPIDTIIKLVQTGVIVTVNSAPNNTNPISSILDTEVDIVELVRLHRK
jgi:hypothetical protein